MADNENQRIMVENGNNMDSNNTNSRIPKLRFPGFTGEWEEKFVKNICDINTGKSNTQDQVTNGLFPFYIRSATPARSNRYLYDCEAVITIGDGQIGKVFHYVNGKFDLHQRCYMMSNFKDVDSRYFYHFFSQYFYNRAMRLTAKATVDSVRLEMISEMPIFLPPTLLEQQKIASCLSELDDLITAQSQKVDALKEKKKGLMQQMFPQKGETVPRLRFPGFARDWEEKKIKDFTFAAGKKNKQNLPYERYSISNELGFCPQKDQFEDGGGYLKDIDCRMYIIVSPKSFAYNPARINVGSIGYQNLGKDVIVSSLYEVFKTKDDCNDGFLWQWFHSDTFHSMVLDIQEGGVRQYFYYDKLRNCTMLLPSLQEQQKIAECLSALDDTITAEAEKLEALRNHKKGLMQQLFPQPAK